MFIIMLCDIRLWGDATTGQYAQVLPYRLEEWVNRNLTEFKTEKYKVQHVGRNNDIRPTRVLLC